MIMGDSGNYALFRDCFCSALTQRMSSTSKAKTKKKRAVKGRKTDSSHKRAPNLEDNDKMDNEKDSSYGNNLADDLVDFSEFLASETFEALPDELRQLSYSQLQAEPKLLDRWIDRPTSELVEKLLPIMPSSVTESLDTYSVLARGTSFGPLLAAALSSYLEAVSAPPPVWSTTRASECEICGRDWVPLTYHHLIPKQVHSKVLKRGWHEEWILNSVAWLCRACHSFVHRVESNEELAKEWFTVEKLMEREDVQDWAGWVGRVRWKAR